jgi:hypothetical protein
LFIAQWVREEDENLKIKNDPPASPGRTESPYGSKVSARSRWTWAALPHFHRQSETKFRSLAASRRRQRHVCLSSFRL